jgi:hypothetical protein
MKRRWLIMDNAERILSSRTELCRQTPVLAANTEEEGGCGVTGFICSIPVTGKNIFAPSVQMHNRGNGKGGGIAAACLLPEQMGVDSSPYPGLLSVPGQHGAHVGVFQGQSG